ncbi:MAG: hypothetical protein RBR86_02940 [Pseudobdellovibrionaceae bacterium]|nr:hypothetical protein [Pseudobdellovibrionaceae bacterium]
MLHQLVKLVFTSCLTNKHPLELYSGGIVADSGSTYPIALLQKMSGEKALELFIRMAPEAMPGTKFLAKQTINTSSRFNPDIIHEKLLDILGDTRLNDLSHGLSIGVMNIEAEGDHALSERLMAVPNLRTGEKHYPAGTSPDLSLAEIVVAATSIPTVNKAAKITGKDGTFCDPTIDQNPIFYAKELRKLNPDEKIELVYIGGFCPSRGKFGELFNRSSAQKFQSWIKGVARQAYKRAESHEMIEDVLDIRVRNFETEVKEEDENHPRFNPIDTSIRQLKLLCETALTDIATRREEYLHHANTLLESYKIRKSDTCTAKLDDTDFNVALATVRQICENTITPAVEKQKTARLLMAEIVEAPAPQPDHITSNFMASSHRVSGDLAAVGISLCRYAFGVVSRFASSRKQKKVPEPNVVSAPLLSTPVTPERDVA